MLLDIEGSWANIEGLTRWEGDIFVSNVTGCDPYNAIDWNDLREWQRHRLNKLNSGGKTRAANGGQTVWELDPASWCGLQFMLAMPPSDTVPKC